MCCVAFLAALSVVVIYVDWGMTRDDWGNNNYCGIGSVPGVLAGTGPNPPRFRVLVPWLCWLLGSAKEAGCLYLQTYFRLRWFGIAFALSAAYWYFATLGVNPQTATALLALYFCAAGRYDYTDIYYEVGFLACGLAVLASPGPQWPIALPVIGLLAGLNRETAVVLPVVALVGGQIPQAVVLGAAVAAGLAIPRIAYKPEKRYCSWAMFGKNIYLIRWLLGGKRPQTAAPRALNAFCLFFALCAVVLGVYTKTLLSRPLVPAETVLGVFFVAMLVPSIWREIRVFAPTMLAVIPMAGA